MIWDDSNDENSLIKSNPACFLRVFESSAITDDFFRNRFNKIIDLRYLLTVLSGRRPWQDNEASLDQPWSFHVYTDMKIQDLVLIGAVSVIFSGGILQRRPFASAHSSDGAQHAVLCDSGYAIRWLLRMIVIRPASFVVPVSDQWFGVLA